MLSLDFILQKVGYRKKEFWKRNHFTSSGTWFYFQILQWEELKTDWTPQCCFWQLRRFCCHKTFLLVWAQSQWLDISDESSPSADSSDPNSSWLFWSCSHLTYHKRLPFGILYVRMHKPFTCSFPLPMRAALLSTVIWSSWCLKVTASTGHPLISVGVLDSLLMSVITISSLIPRDLVMMSQTVWPRLYMLSFSWRTFANFFNPPWI